MLPLTFFFGAPVYVLEMLLVIGGSGLLIMWLGSRAHVKKRWGERIWRVFWCICLGAVLYAGVGFYNDNLPTVDDRSLMLSEYHPFAEGTRAVTLDEEAALRFDDEAAFSVTLDGATALYPVYAAFVQAVYPAGEYNGYRGPMTENARKAGLEPGKYDGIIECSNTVGAYERLIDGLVDVIFVAGPSQEQLDMAAQAGVELHLTPIGREAFVFFVNSKNPVEGLTVEQVQGIYTGEITNWREVGGNNQSIRAFQRAANSGSQTALLRLMDGLPLMEPETEDRISAMDGIISQVAAYRNHRNAIGFSFHYYAAEMDANDRIKLLALNGVAPTRETIRDGSYPIASEFYAVTAAPVGQPAPQETDPNIAALLDWILSEQGQEIIEKTGYVARQ